MSRLAPLKLVSAQPPRAKCECCGRELSAIERWCNCPARRLAVGLLWLRDQFRAGLAR